VETVLLIIGLLFLTAFVFAVWLVVRVTGLIFSAIFGLARRKPAPAPLAPPGWTNCAHPACRSANVAHARFCQRCGAPMGALARPTASAPPMRYVA
jgi:hypothetical protein